MLGRFIIALLFLSFISFATDAQTTALKWWDPTTSTFPVIEGQAWPDQVKSPYDRLPAKAEQIVRKDVWSLARQSAGLMIRFRTNSEQIKVRYTVTGSHSMPHMPSTGVSGVDLYALSSDGNETWSAGKYSFGDTITYTFSNLTANDGYHAMGREYRLFLPLYNGVKWLEIGVPDSNLFTPLPVRSEKPIVVYGTSIAQGACASRPGMAWTAILQRKMERPLINLGFSGNGLLEKELIDMIKDIDAKVFVLDCLPNLLKSKNLSLQEIKSRILLSVDTLRKYHPKTPIVLAEHAGYTDEALNKVKKEAYSEINVIAREAFAELQAKGVKGLYLIPQKDFDQDIETMVDAIHPSDLGMMRYAIGYEKHLRQLLQEPIGTVPTTKARPQLREPGNYDWDARHLEQLRLNNSDQPSGIFLGNSIVHFWGGVPKGPVSRGNDSWNAVFAPLNFRNMACGWDRIENVLWRVYHDELEGISPKQILVMIGTNNLEINTDKELTAGWEALVDAIKNRQPQARIVMVGMLPRARMEARIKLLNQSLAEIARRKKVSYADVGNVLLNPGGKINDRLFSDGLHPNETGYQKLGEAFKPILKY